MPPCNELALRFRKRHCLSNSCLYKCAPFKYKLCRTLGNYRYMHQTAFDKPWALLRIVLFASIHTLLCVKLLYFINGGTYL